MTVQEDVELGTWFTRACSGRCIVEAAVLGAAAGDDDVAFVIWSARKARELKATEAIEICRQAAIRGGFPKTFSAAMESCEV